MTIPTWPKLALNEDVLPEPFVDETSLAVWLKVSVEGDCQLWERIRNVPRAGIVAERGICVTAAASIQARQRQSGLISKLMQRLHKNADGATWTLPNGDSAEQWGERQANLMLAWSEDPTALLDVATVKARWPQCEQVQQIGKNLFVIRGIQPPETPTTANQPAAAVAESEPREIANQSLAAARQAGDRRKEAAALTDLGILALNNRDVGRAVSYLQEALTITRQIGDRTREADVLGGLGLAMLTADEDRRAFARFQEELASARAASDPFAEKTALAHLGIVHVRKRDGGAAIAFFGQALDLARQLGDQRHEADLLWDLGIQHAEMERRSQAIACAEAAVNLMRRLGKPAGTRSTWPSTARARPPMSLPAWRLRHEEGWTSGLTARSWSMPGPLRQAFSLHPRLVVQACCAWPCPPRPRWPSISAPAARG